MKKTILTITAETILAAMPASTNLIAFWDFNDGFDVADETVQIVHTASQRSGTLYQQRADTDGNGKGGNQSPTPPMPSMPLMADQWHGTT